MSTPSRVTPTEVKQIVTTTLSDAIVQIWIDAASEIVDQHEECIDGDAALLKQVELYLSAHLVSLLPGSTGAGVVTKQKFDVMETDYAVATVDKLINSTVYGQTANSLSKGCLASVNDQAVGFCALGGDC